MYRRDKHKQSLSSNHENTFTRKAVAAKTHLAPTTSVLLVSRALRNDVAEEGHEDGRVGDVAMLARRRLPVTGCWHKISNCVAAL
jgi:hypothetical protein